MRGEPRGSAPVRSGILVLKAVIQDHLAAGSLSYARVLGGHPYAGGRDPKLAWTGVCFSCSRSVASLKGRNLGDSQTSKGLQ